MTAKEYLNRLVIMDDEINRKQRRLETLRNVAFNSTPSYGDEMVQHTREKNPFEKIMAKVVDLDREIDKEVDALVDLKAEVWEQLDKLSDERFVRVLWLRYAERKTWNAIAGELSFTSRYIRKIHIQALESLDILLAQKKTTSVPPDDHLSST